MMTLIVGVDIGNSTTEACVAAVREGEVAYLGSGLAATTGVKGTVPNVTGAVRAIDRALGRAGRTYAEVDTILLNEATPVISGLAMETITETIITESTMIGHNPQTPGGEGLGVGVTVAFEQLGTLHPGGDDLICVIPAAVDFEEAAAAIEAAAQRGVTVSGAIVQRDDARLIANRLTTPIPIVDEVTHVERVPLGMAAAVEVAAPGRSVRTLANSYGLATVFTLTPEETRVVAPVARALMGTRSAVVVRTPGGDVTDRRIPAGTLELHGERAKKAVDVNGGAAEIMDALKRVQPLADVVGETGSHVGGMLAGVRETMADLTGDEVATIRIRDVLAADTFVPREVRGGLAGEFALENAVALAAMVRTSRGPIEQVARALQEAARVTVRVGGVEAEMAVRGALTTPGTATPVAVLDLGGGSTDAAFALGDDASATYHAAGAGDLVTKLIGSELGIDDRELAEHVKTSPLAKVESLFHIRLEDGTVQYFDKALPAETFARVVALTEQQGMVPIPVSHGLDRIRRVRRDAKRRVFAVNALRALREVAPHGNVRGIDFVVLIGGSALDFEIPELVAEALADFGVVCGTGNVRAVEGPRNAVATGLVEAYVREEVLA
ncbi:diol dehydratase reactivase subunit alpha [Conexibacter sp. JD483]|nr:MULTISPECIES: diol dehydratase reactivase subunit alpha [unclassified Conexibacter]MDO8184916.1 diol dehydratase reactivase subunit alpha [Conexibacter sp. CPCC 205706]MDO8198060.1 diol dehydratase reactivase subunit alpha [Conexibacter sp. CPCC 205762]MDR9371349.1 diol dehydratase reactivase subunit alpha [Conexibacter sp. JD483]